jgi:diketogulonate reductase-like aldo/keto reductase
MRALEEVVTSGRARFVGVSNFTGAMMAECMRTRRIDVSQVGYPAHLNPVSDLGRLREVDPMCHIGSHEDHLHPAHARLLPVI